MWYGEYEHTLDEKDRFVLPAKFRRAIDEKKISQFYLTRGLDQCLFMLASDDWQKLEEKFKSESFTRQQSRFFNRLYFSGAYEVPVDGQGRILIPSPLKEFAAIKKEVMVIGVSDRIEIWDREKWQKFYDENRKRFEEMAENLFG